MSSIGAHRYEKYVKSARLPTTVGIELSECKFTIVGSNLGYNVSSVSLTTFPTYKLRGRWMIGRVTVINKVWTAHEVDFAKD